MHRQVGDELVLDDFGLAQRGLIIRHLILPNRLAGSYDSLSWLVHDISPKVTVSIMSQYYPTHLATQIAELCRKISASEYSEVLELVDKLGLENGWIQGTDAAENYLPNFERGSHPFQLEKLEV